MSKIPKLPNYSEEEMDNIFKELKVGDKLAKSSYDSWSGRFSIVVVSVERVTPKGRLRLSNGKLIPHLGGYYKYEDCIEYIRYRERLLKVQNMLFDLDRNRREIVRKADEELLNKIVSLYKEVEVLLNEDKSK